MIYGDLIYLPHKRVMSSRRQRHFLNAEVHSFYEADFLVERVIRESCLAISIPVDFLRRPGGLVN
jgi:hypothetical protein